MVAEWTLAMACDLACLNGVSLRSRALCSEDSVNRRQWLSRPVIVCALYAASALSVREVHAQRPMRLDDRARRVLAVDFSDITSVRELRDGSVVLVDRKERRLYHVDSALQVATPVGRNGAGPQEYGAVGPLYAGRGDSTLMFDAANRRWVQLLGAAIVRTAAAADAGLPDRGAAVLGRDSLGRFLVLAGRPLTQSPTAATIPDSSSVLLWHASRSRVDTVGRLASLGRRAIVRAKGADGVPTRLSIVAPVVVVSDQALLTRDGWLAVATQDPFRVQWTSPAGATTASAPINRRRRSFGAKERQSYASHLEKLGAAPPSVARADDWPADMPAFPERALFEAPTGQLVLGLMFQSETPDTRYLVIDRQGRVTDQLALPETDRIVGFGEGTVYVVRHGALGEQQLARYRWPTDTAPRR